MSKSADPYYDDVVSSAEYRQRICFDCVIRCYPCTAERGSLVKAQPRKRKEVPRRFHQQVLGVSSVLVESYEFPILTVVLFSSEAEPAASTTACWIHYDR